MNRLTTFSLLTAGLLAAGSASAAPITFGTGGWTGFTGTDTVDGVTITITPTSDFTVDPDTLGIGGTGDANLGVTGGIGGKLNITLDTNGTTGDTETLLISFDTDVYLQESTIGNRGGTERAVYTSTAFAGLTGVTGSNVESHSGSVITTTTGSTFDDDNAYNGILVTAGTNIVFSSSNTAAGSDSTVSFRTITVEAVPEPGSLALMGLGGLLIARRRRG